MGSLRARGTVMAVAMMLASLLLVSTVESSGPSNREYLASLPLQGTLTFDNTTTCSAGSRNLVPAGVVYPTSVDDIATIVSAVASSDSDLTIAARGLGHNIRIRSQAHNGIIVEMTSLKGIKVFPEGDAASNGAPFVEASGGEMWVDVLKASLEHGLAPRSWTDYLYLTVGGTLSNAGVSGQSFRHGPEVSNVLALQVVTGTGDVVTCSPTENSNLFFAVLGGLGQFGIITSARIVLEQAPQRVRWMRALYTDFATFKADQEFLISSTARAFDYVEGFVVKNDANPVNGWAAVPFVGSEIHEAMIPSEAQSILYCLEVTKAYSVDEAVDEMVESMLAPLRFHRELLFKTDTTYFKFLDRVYEAEAAKKLPTPSCECVTIPHACEWNAPWPLLSLFIPASAIEQFDLLVLKRLVNSEFNGPILVYPMNKSKWDKRLSVAVPEGSEELFYMVSFLSNKLPETALLAKMMKQDESILRISEKLGGKQYLPRHKCLKQWRRHFGSKWASFVHNKETFDPRAILAPGQNLFSTKRPAQYIRMFKD